MWFFSVKICILFSHVDNDHFLEKKNNFAGNNLLPLHYTEENLLKEYGTWPVKSVLFKNLTQVRSRKIKQDHVNNVWKMKMEGWIKELCLKITRSCITACLPSKMGGVDCTGYRSSLQIHILTCSFWELSFPVACSLLLAIYAKQNVTIHVIKWVIHQGRIVKFFFFFIGTICTTIFSFCLFNTRNWRWKKTSQYLIVLWWKI